MRENNRELDQIQEMLLQMGFIWISDVFVIPRRKISIGKNYFFYNHYSLHFKSESNKKIYYLRSVGDNFCITPFKLFKLRESAVFSIGKGLDRDKNETTIILGEISCKNIEVMIEQERQLNEYLKAFNFIKYNTCIVEEFGKNWLRIWIMTK